MDSVLPLVDALYSIYIDDRAFRHSIEFGVLYSSVLPGSGNIIGEKAIFISNYGRDIEEAFIKYAGVKAAFGYNPRSTTNWKGTRPSTRRGGDRDTPELADKDPEHHSAPREGQKGPGGGRAHGSGAHPGSEGGYLFASTSTRRTTLPRFP